MWGSSQPLPPLQSSCRVLAWTSTHSPSLHHSHWLFVPSPHVCVANRLVTATSPYLLTLPGITSLSRTLLSRSLGHSFAYSSASCPSNILSGWSLGLANANSATAIERCASPKEFLLGPSRTSGFVIDTVNRIWHLFNSLGRLLSHIFSRSLGIRAFLANLIPAMIQRLPAVRFRLFGRAETHFSELNDTTC